jgi:hypothetical protein
MGWLGRKLGRAGLDELLQWNTAGPTTGTAAIHSDRLADAIGINTHLGFRNAIWGQTQAWRPLLLDLGVRYHRTSLGTLADAKEDFLWLWTNGGLRGLILVSPFRTVDGVSPTFGTAQSQRQLNFLRNQIGVEKLIGLEGPNEPNNHATATSGWEMRVRDQMKWLHETAKADEALARLPIVGPSLHRRTPDDYAALGDLGDCLDVVNLHNYTGGQMPSRAVRGFGDNTTLDAIMADARALGRGKPLWVTEYNHATHEDPARWSRFVMPDTVAARYLLRGLALMFRKGAERIFVYALMDEVDEEESYGLVAYDASLRLEPRPAYHALRSFLARLSDPGPVHAPQPLGYGLSGDLADLETLLLQKRSGTWVLLIWQEVSLWDRVTVSETVPARRPVTLTLPFPASVVAYEPSESRGGERLASCARTVGLSVPGHVMMLEIDPAPDHCGL